MRRSSMISSCVTWESEGKQKSKKQELKKESIEKKEETIVSTCAKWDIAFGCQYNVVSVLHTPTIELLYHALCK